MTQNTGVIRGERLKRTGPSALVTWRREEALGAGLRRKAFTGDVDLRNQEDTVGCFPTLILIQFL